MCSRPQVPMEWWEATTALVAEREVVRLDANLSSLYNIIRELESSPARAQAMLHLCPPQPVPTPACTSAHPNLCSPPHAPVPTPACTCSCYACARTTARLPQAIARAGSEYVRRVLSPEATDCYILELLATYSRLYSSWRGLCSEHEMRPHEEIVGVVPNTARVALRGCLPLRGSPCFHRCVVVAAVPCVHPW